MKWDRVLSFKNSLPMFVGLLAVSAACRTPWDIERDRARRLTPPKIDDQADAARVSDTPAPADGTRVNATYQIRIYVDRDYRRETANWQKELEELVDQASSITEGLYGARLHIESIRRWETSNPKDTLTPALDSLARIDSGRDVHWVVGFLGSSSLVNPSHDQLGKAYLFARHFVLRGLRNAEEITAIEDSFKYLSSQERDQLIRSRRRHRQIAVFLHEWAHTLGAPHARSPEFINYERYDSKQARFDEDTTKLIAVSLRHWQREALPDAEVQSWGAELQALLSVVPAGSWEATSTEQLRNYVDQMASSAVTSTSGSHLSKLDASQLNRAEQAMRKGRYRDARGEIVPLVTRYPNDAHVRILACQVEVAIGPLTPEASKQCEKAASLEPDDAESQISLAEVHLVRKDIANAVKSLAKVHEQLTAEASTEAATAPSKDEPASKPTADTPAAKGATPAWAAIPKETPPSKTRANPAPEKTAQRPVRKLSTEPRVWAYLADLFHRAGCLTWADDAAKRSLDPEKERAIHTWVVRTRRWLGTGPAGAVPPDREGEFVDAMEKLQERVFTESRKNLQGKIEALRDSFPLASGPHIAQCEVHYRSGSVADAKKSCERALALDDEAFQAHYVLGLAYEAIRQMRPAIAHLERAIELEPGFEGCWRALMSAYRYSNKSRELSALKARYQQQFSKSAP
jgi:tetratricopeptide (TPR) repeat protein